MEDNLAARGEGVGDLGGLCYPGKDMAAPCSSSLCRLYTVVGLWGAGFTGFYVVVGWSLVRGGPGDIGLAGIVLLLMLAQAIPSSGLVARLLLRQPGPPKPRRWMLAGLATTLVLVGLGLMVSELFLVLVAVWGVLVLSARSSPRCAARGSWCGCCCR